MKKNFLRVLIVVVIIFASIEVAYAYSTLGQGFGGTIIKVKAFEVERLENASYRCAVAGKTIEVKPILSKYPKSYMIPATTPSKSESTPSTGQWILGTYTGKTTISCVKTIYPWDTQTVILDTIKLFGTSKT
jgi:hypothetical protein